MSSSVTTQLPLAPLGAGDLIDRAVRLYRRHLFVLIRTAAPPVIIVAVGWVLTSISVRKVFFTTHTEDVLFYGLLLFAAIVIMLAGYLFILVVMGGATRTLVAHLLRNDPVTARATYNAVRARFWGLVGASLIMLFWILAAVFVSSSGGQMVAFLTFIIAGGLSLIAPGWLSAIVMFIGMLLTTGVSLWLFFVIVGRIVYVPQVM